MKATNHALLLATVTALFGCGDPYAEERIAAETRRSEEKRRCIEMGGFPSRKSDSVYTPYDCRWPPAMPTPEQP